MSPDRAPWWYSGDEPDAEPQVASDVEDVGEDLGEDLGEESAEDGAPPVADWTALAAGAQRLVDWASERILAPHVDHGDPRDHPQCVVCRTQLLLGEGPGPVRPPSDEAPAARPGDPRPDEAAWADEAHVADAADGAAATRPVIEWIAIVDDDEPPGRPVDADPAV